MPLSRLELALEMGRVSWPDGPILALRPMPGQPGLPQDRTLVVHGFKPAYEAWAADGYSVTSVAPNEPFEAAYIMPPRARDHARQLILRAVTGVAPGGLIVVDGVKTDGIESLAKAVKSVFGPIDIMSKAHGKLFWFSRPQVLPDGLDSWGKWTGGPAGWHTAPGVFSADAVDTGSALLAKHLPLLVGRCADLGAGWGYLSAEVLKSSELVTHLDLVEAEWAALECARKNVQDPRAEFHWADATDFSAEPYDGIVMNPPFHRGRQADPELGRRFLRSAARLLKPAGTLALVANRHLPYEAVLSESFAEVSTQADMAGFKVIHARKPRRKAPGR